MSCTAGWLALLALLARSQDEPQIVDGVAAQAGNAVITLSELNRFVETKNARRPVSTREEAQKLQVEGLREILTTRLEAQAGEDMGLDPEQVERQVQYRLDMEREEIGLAGYVDKLRAEGQDALGELRNQKSDLYVYMWRAAKVGISVAGRRPTRDRYIRPGELRGMFEENRDALYPTMVRLQVLVVSSEAAGSPEEARASCEKARERVLAGEDMGAIVLELGADLRDTEGLTPEIPQGSIADPTLRKFVDQAEIGDLSSVSPIVGPKGPTPELGYQLVMLYDRREGGTGDFGEVEVQRKLRSYFINKRDERVLERQKALLRSESYTWVHPRLRGLTGEPAPAR